VPVEVDEVGVGDRLLPAPGGEDPADDVRADLPVQLVPPLRVPPAQVVVERVAGEVVGVETLGAGGGEGQVAQPREALGGALGADGVAQERLRRLPGVGQHLQRGAVGRVGDVGDEALQERRHDVGQLGLGEVVGGRRALRHDVGDQRQRERVAVGEAEDRRRGGGGDAARPQVGEGVVRVEVAQRDLAQLVVPPGVGAPRR
jgi:hypothetical protein